MTKTIGASEGYIVIDEKCRKLAAHSSHLLTLFLQLRERYALLQPMLHDQQVCTDYGSWKQAPGFKILKSSLFLSCCHDVSKLSLDKYDHTPSIKRLMHHLEDDRVRDHFRNCYRANARSAVDPELDAASRAIEEQYEEHYGTQRQAEFDMKYVEAVSRWKLFAASPRLKSFYDIRNKVTGHTQIHFNGKEYLPFDIATAGITWRDLREVIDEMQALVELLSNLIRDAGFAWSSLDKLLAKAAKDFWCERRAADKDQALLLG